MLGRAFRACWVRCLSVTDYGEVLGLPRGRKTIGYPSCIKNPARGNRANLRFLWPELTCQSQQRIVFKVMEHAMIWQPLQHTPCTLNSGGSYHATLEQPCMPAYLCSARHIPSDREAAAHTSAALGKIGSCSSVTVSFMPRS